MRIFSSLTLILCSLAALFTAGCSDDSVISSPSEGGDEAGYTRLTLRVALNEDINEANRQFAKSRGSFDNFSIDDDKWGINGENLEDLRIIILDSNGYVEANQKFAGSNSTQMGEYSFKVKADDTKTIILLGNESGYTVGNAEMTNISASEMFEKYQISDYVNINDIKALTINLDDNLSDSNQTRSLKTPLPISAIYNEYLPAGLEEISRDYWMHRAAVKFSFRILNSSKFNHNLEAISLSRVCDKEFLFPDADFETNEFGHQEVTAYRTPADASEKKQTFTFTSPLYLPAQMEQAVEAFPSFYLPEGLVTTDILKANITLDGTQLAAWENLKWEFPDGTVVGNDDPRLHNLPRNTHVVVNITINGDNNDMDFVACVQPYSLVELRPWFGLERDPDGNIITKWFEDGTYIVATEDGEQRKDKDNDIVRKIFSDRSLLCVTEVKKDYIHDNSITDYYYYFEKDYSGGNMIVIRQESAYSEYNDQILPIGRDHDHDINDRPLFVQTKDVEYLRVEYDSNGKKTYYSEDRDGAEIVQVNGFQFREDNEDGSPNSMRKYIGTYLVEYTDAEGNTVEELRWYLDDYTPGKGGRAIDITKGVDWSDHQNPKPYFITKSTTRTATHQHSLSASEREIIRQLKERSAKIFRMLFPNR
ncbi:MAG: hypothetical protein NC201_05070 [Prevotella sp.]|nr:hypothetical protein [Bacteroides sp.]MCM1366602.1 hypothetical protein [Prevotella sp.]MCM1437301.1 hypothetical protein [Prevotella sp.]